MVYLELEVRTHQKVLGPLCVAIFQTVLRTRCASLAFTFLPKLTENLTKLSQIFALTEPNFTLTEKAGFFSKVLRVFLFTQVQIVEAGTRECLM